MHQQASPIVTAYLREMRFMVVLGKSDEVDELAHSIRMASDEGVANQTVKVGWN